MANTLYWLDIDGDRTGLEIFVNAVPAERMLRTNGLRFPINEYIVQGTNRVEARRSLWPSNAPDEEGGTMSMKLVRASFSGATSLGETVIFERSATFESSPPRAVLIAAEFASDQAGMSLPFFDPPGPDGRRLVIERLARVANDFRSGNGDGVVDWMSGYMADYVRAYPPETHEDMVARVLRMVGSFRGARVDFNPDQIRLEPIEGTHLIDCISPEGAAVRVQRENSPPYDMWSVVGIRDGKVALFR